MGKKKDAAKAAAKAAETFTLSDQDRASVAASSFNAATVLIAAGLSKGKAEDSAEATLGLASSLYELRVAWMTENQVGNASRQASGGGGSSKSFGGSSGSSGGSGSKGATTPMIGFYSDLINDIEAADGSTQYSMKKFKTLPYEVASAAIDTAIELRDELKG